MRFILSFCFSLLFIGTAISQIGIKAGYRSLNNEEWETGLGEAFNDEFESANGWSIGVNYWFRLKSRRIEFTPEISGGRFEETSASAADIKRKHTFYSFHFNTNIYLFDLGEDCDCPVWSKDGNSFQKGFFIQLSPGVTRMTNELGGQLENSNDKKNYFEFGVGAGIDFGLSDFLTITPMAKLFFSPNAEWGNIFTPIDSTPRSLEGTYRQFFAGLKVGFRFDEL